MDTLIHADIFFFVTTVAVVAIALVFIITLIYVIRVLRQVEGIGKEIKAETVLVREDIRNLRGTVRQEGFRLRSFVDFFEKIFGSKKKSSRSKH